MSAQKHSVRNSVFTAVISGLILAFLLWFGPRLWAWFVTVIAQLYSFMITTVLIPIWLLGVLILAIIPTMIMIIVLIVAMLRPPTKQPAWLNYTKDDFDGMTWRWEYSNYSVNNLQCYCPNDDTILIHSRGYESITFHCETCGKKFGPFERDIDYMLEKTERQIDRKVRNGEWEKVLLKTKVVQS